MTIEVSRYDVYMREEPLLPTLFGIPLEIVNRFKYSGSLFTLERVVREKVIS